MLFSFIDFATSSTPHQRNWPAKYDELTLRQYIGEHHAAALTEDGQMYLCHQLDFATSGLILCATSSEAACWRAGTSGNDGRAEVGTGGGSCRGRGSRAVSDELARSRHSTTIFTKKWRFTVSTRRTAEAKREMKSIVY